MDHDLEWLQEELSGLFSRLTGREVKISAGEALMIVLAQQESRRQWDILKLLHR